MSIAVSTHITWPALAFLLQNFIITSIIITDIIIITTIIILVWMV